MNTLKYTITKFDEELKIVVVTFEGGGWAEIGLTTPLPKNIGELEEIIKRFTAPKEAIEAQINPDADLSYINAMVGVEKECERLILNQKQEEQIIDPQVEAQMKIWEEAQFQKKVAEALVALGVVQQNPSEIPVTI